MLKSLRLTKSFFHTIVILFFASKFGITGCADDTVIFNDLNEKVSGHVIELLGTEKYDLPYYTDYYNETTVVLNQTGQAMVSSDDIRCSRVGAFYLNNGGNAIDAAVAATLCLSVIEFQSTGLSGGGVALSYFRRKIIALDFRETSSHCLVCNGTYTLNKDGRVFGIPGMIRGLFDLWWQGGRLKWSSLFDLPIIIAFKGWQVKPSFYNTVKNHQSILIKDPFLKQLLFREGEVKRVGDYIRNLPLARTLYMLSKNVHSFYTGFINKVMVEQLRNMSIINGTINFSKYTTQPLDLLVLKVNETYSMVTTSQRTGGPYLSYILNAMGDYKHANPGAFHEDTNVSNDYYVNLAGIIKHAYHDISLIPNQTMTSIVRDAYSSYQAHIAPPPSIQDETQQRSKIYDMDSADIHGTVSLNVLDKCGNAVSLESSINDVFGAKYTFPTLGIVANTKLFTWPYYDKVTGEPLYNKTDDYIATRHINYVAPAFIVDKNISKIQGIFSGTGGKKSPAALAQVLINHYYRNMKLNSSIEHVFAEEVRPIPLEIRKILKEKKYLVVGNIRQDYTSTISGISVVFTDRYQPKIITGVGDFRRNGGAVGA